MVPSAATTSISSKRPSRLSTSWAVGRVKPARVAPPRLPAEPKPMMPETVKVRAGPWSRTLTRSPTAKPCFSAVWASTTISFGPLGSRPERTVVPAWSSGAELIETPRVGAPPVVTGLPSLSTNWANPVTEPSATLTPSTALTSLRTSSGIGSRTSPIWPVNTSSERTATSMPWVTSSNRLVKVALMVSVST